ncbi:DNA-binding transcriptional MerR regulator [Tamaricihabitans halophyticus]|uniref:DNA-binding transcriptional MerR regulator n=1 Tax=Tamaricihabitans halophyticus TaxID=1262583 RepID=A0A4R2QB90_9PSEU|nr:MerR family transcriptional regulator [Tamaricihabitans halophyticus]TCP45809.1 DNA-binding transcriptional MerR regulator [Tamaricihabitans halophyticus]
MAWSTREIAELAGTSLRAVRHYHEVGLLAEPERRANGYKQYGVAHLVRLLRIKRLVDLGFSLTQIAEMGDADDHPEQALRTLDAELAATIERLQRARVELGYILQKSAPTELPPEFVPAATETPMSKEDRTFLTVLGRVLGPEGMASYAGLVRRPIIDPVGLEFENLPADADERARVDLAERLVPLVQAIYREHPDLLTAPMDAPRGEQYATKNVRKAMVDIYNPAQVDVLTRLRGLLRKPATGKTSAKPREAE